MNNYHFNSKYYISTGRLGVMYTLRYSAIESYPNGDGSFKDRTLDIYLCTLSKNPDEALQKAKDYITEVGGDYTKYNLSTDFVLNERAEAIYGSTEERRKQISEQILVSGKYQGKHVSELPEDYLKWCFNNLYSGVNYEIINSYVEENDLVNEWVKLGTFNIYNKLLNFKNQFQTNIDSRVLVFGGQPKVQKVINKNGSYNMRTIDFLKEYIKTNKLVDFRECCESVENDDVEYVVRKINLVKMIEISNFNFKRYDFMNKIVALTITNVYRSLTSTLFYKYELSDFTYDDVYNMIVKNERNKMIAIMESSIK